MATKKKRERNKVGAASFAIIRCDRCHGDRVLENPCSECGALPRPGEVNHHVVSRREALRIVEAFEHEPCLASDEPYVDVLAGFTDTFTQAAIRVMAQPFSRDELEESGHLIAAFRAFVREVIEVGELRPNSLEKAVGKTGVTLLEVWELSKTALGTSNTKDAQELRDQAQLLLDNAHEAIANVAVMKNASEALVENADEVPLARRVMRALTIVEPSLSDLSELMEYGRKNASEVIGRKIDNQAGLSFLLLSITGQHLLNWERLQRKLREGTTIVADKERLREISAMDGALEHLGQLNRLDYEALDAFARAVAGVEEPTTVLRRLSKTIAELYENAAPLFTWFRLLESTASGTDRFRKYEERDATDHVDWLMKRHPSALFADLPAHLRNAGSHGATLRFNEHEEKVIIDLRSHQEEVAYDQFVDRCLGVIESVMAAYWALETALLECDIAIPVPYEDNKYLGTGPLESAAALLDLAHPGQVSTDGSTGEKWCLEAPFIGEESIVMAITLAQQCENEVESISVSSTLSGDARVVIPLKEYLAYSQAMRNTEFDEAFALMDYLDACMVSGRSLLTDDNIRWALWCFSRVFQQDTPDAIPLTRRVRSFAKRRDMHETEEQATKLIRALRTGTIKDTRQQFRNLPAGEQPTIPDPRNVTLMLNQ